MAELTIEINPLSDYLFYVFGRANRLGFPVESCVALSFPPPGQQGCTLPTIVAQLDITDFNHQLQTLCEEYKHPAASRYRLSRKQETIPYEVLSSILQEAESQWPSFLSFWHEHVKPVADTVREYWHYEQSQDCVLYKFEETTRIDWPYDRCRIFVSAFHDAASAPRGSGCLFCTIIKGGPPVKRSLARLVGHEGSHVLAEHLYHGHSDLSNAIQQAANRGFSTNLIVGETEETLAIVLQHRLPVECQQCSEQAIYDGAIDSTLASHISWVYGKYGYKGAEYVEQIYWCMQHRWHEYRSFESHNNVIDFLFACMERVLQQKCNPF